MANMAGVRMISLHLRQSMVKSLIMSSPVHRRKPTIVGLFQIACMSPMTPGLKNMSMQTTTLLMMRMGTLPMMMMMMMMTTFQLILCLGMKWKR